MIQHRERGCVRGGLFCHHIKSRHVMKTAKVPSLSSIQPILSPLWCTVSYRKEYMVKIQTHPSISAYQCLHVVGCVDLIKVGVGQTPDLLLYFLLYVLLHPFPFLLLLIYRKSSEEQRTDRTRRSVERQQKGAYKGGQRR